MDYYIGTIGEGEYRFYVRPSVARNKFSQFSLQSFDSAEITPIFDRNQEKYQNDYKADKGKSLLETLADFVATVKDLSASVKIIAAAAVALLAAFGIHLHNSSRSPAVVPPQFQQHVLYPNPIGGQFRPEQRR